MMTIAAFRPEHLPALEVQPAQSVELGDNQTLGYGVFLAEQGPAWSAVRGDRVLAAFGLIEHSAAHASAWALISGEIAARELRELTETILRAAALDIYVRVDTMVRTDFARARSWALRLGFQREGTMRAWGENSIDFDMYARVRRGER